MNLLYDIHDIYWLESKGYICIYILGESEKIAH
jgi:hypothetical protein